MAVRMIKIYLSLYTACGCITLFVACLLFPLATLPYANTESVCPAASSYSFPSVQQLNLAWDDWYDDGHDIGGFLSEAAPICPFSFLVKRHLLEAAGWSSWSLPGHKKGCDLSVLCAKAVGVFPGVFFLFVFSKSKLNCREKFRATQSEEKTHTQHYELKVCWKCRTCCKMCSCFVRLGTCERKNNVLHSELFLTTTGQHQLAKEGPSPWVSSHNCLCHKCMGPSCTNSHPLGPPDWVKACKFKSPS